MSVLNGIAFLYYLAGIIYFIVGVYKMNNGKAKDKK